MSTSQEEVQIWDKENKAITGTIEPWDTWDKVRAVKGFPGGLIAFLQTSPDSDGCGYPFPTIVQAYAWPILQSGKDLVGVAKTGSGKTLAFLLPGFVKLRKLKKNLEVDTTKGPALLALTPTRELCHQIFSDTEKFGRPVSITAACCYGGANKREQEWALKQGPDCLIATPGRLNDLINNWTVDLTQVRYFVLDEADRMLDMGFVDAVKTILEKVPAETRQTSMFTATWPSQCKQLAETYIKDPIQIQLGTGEITTNANIKQHVEVLENEDAKKVSLRRIIAELPAGDNVLVFSNSKKKCKDLAYELKAEGVAVVELHGDLDQRARDDSLNRLRSGDARVMVATDLASRGLDVRNIAVVVNFDCPNSPEDYVHRIGRTGRANDSGNAYTFVLSYKEEEKAAHIVSIMEKAGVTVPDDLRAIAATAAPEAGKDDWSASGDAWKKDEWSAKPAEDEAAKPENGWGKTDDAWKKKDDGWEKSSSSWPKEESKGKDEWKKDEWKNEEPAAKDEWKKDAWKDDKKDAWKDDKKAEAGAKDDWKKTEWKKEDTWKRPAEEHAEAPPAKVAAVPSAKSTSEVKELVVSGQGTKLKIVDLKAWLEERSLPSMGVKAALIERIQQAITDGA